MLKKQSPAKGGRASTDSGDGLQIETVQFDKGKLDIKTRM
jgi:hypothetical protein